LNEIIVAAAFASLAASLAVACTGSDAASPGMSSGQGETGEGGAGGTLPCDVDAVLAKSCRSCHSSPPAFGAPMPLLTLADLHAAAKITPGKKVFEMVGARIHDDAAPMPQAPNARLSGPEAATLDSWIADGAPAGGAACGTAPSAAAGGPAPLACAPDQQVQQIRPASKFAVTSDPDLYVCYGFDTDASEKLHVIAGAAQIDNKAVVHHVLLYQADATVSGVPTPCGAGGGSGWRLVTGWAPGGKNFELPPEAGFAEELGTTHWALQIHYNNAQGLKDQADQTGFDLCATNKLRPNDADILATGTVGIQIPPRSKYQVDCDLAFPASYGNINVVSSWAHMHKLGRAESATRLRNGEATTILSAPNYDFSTGAGANAVNVALAAGDTVHTTCQWQNAGDTTVKFGEATSDEMCFAFLTYYPKITQPKFKWVIPASPLVSKCTGAVIP